MKRLLLLAILFCLPNAVQADEVLPAGAYKGFVVRTVEGYILPALDRFVAVTSSLEQSFGEDCRDDVAIRRAFEDTAEAWAGIGFLRFGPMLAGHRAERIQFWPDRKGIGARQVQRAIAAKDDGATTVEALAEQSVAMQGLPAMELMLYRLPAPKDDAETAYRCQYLQAIAGNLSVISKELRADWGTRDGGFAAVMMSPGGNNSVYKTPQEAAAEVLAIFSTAIQSIQLIKLGPVTAGEGERLFPKRVPFWRSGLALDNIAAEIEAMRKLHDAAGFAGFLPEDEKSAEDSARRELDFALAAVRALPGPLVESVEDEDVAGKLRFIQIIFENVKAIYAGRIPRATGLAIGFTALDGD
jgi:hypothetical protein